MRAHIWLSNSHEADDEHSSEHNYSHLERSPYDYAVLDNHADVDYPTNDDCPQYCDGNDDQRLCHATCDDDSAPLDRPEHFDEWRLHNNREFDLNEHSTLLPPCRSSNDGCKPYAINDEAEKGDDRRDMDQASAGEYPWTQECLRFSHVRSLESIIVAPALTWI